MYGWGEQEVIAEHRICLKEGWRKAQTLAGMQAWNGPTAFTWHSDRRFLQIVILSLAYCSSSVQLWEWLGKFVLVMLLSVLPPPCRASICLVFNCSSFSVMKMNCMKMQLAEANAGSWEAHLNTSSNQGSAWFLLLTFALSTLCFPFWIVLWAWQLLYNLITWIYLGRELSGLFKYY